MLLIENDETEKERKKKLTAPPGKFTQKQLSGGKLYFVRTEKVKSL